MKKPVTNRLVRNPYLSEQEEKLAKFCEENGIHFSKQKDLSGRGQAHYQLDFKPGFIDETEAKVSQHLDRTGIRYKFGVDLNGTHHYEFAEMIDLDNYPGSEEVIIDRKYVEHCIAEMPNLRRDRKKEIKLLEQDSRIKELQKSIDSLKLNIEVLEKDNGLVNWYHRLWYKIWKPYRVKVDTEIQKTIKSLKDKIRSKEAEIKLIEAEKENIRNLLILADIIPDEDVKPKNEPIDGVKLITDADRHRIIRECDTDGYDCIIQQG